MKKIAFWILVIIISILLYGTTLATLMVIELYDVGTYQLDNLNANLKMALIIVLPQILIQLVVLKFITKRYLLSKSTH